MQLGTLRMFCDVIETGSFSVAAEKHGVTPSAISQSFVSLEKAWGVMLVNREEVDALVLALRSLKRS